MLSAPPRHADHRADAAADQAGTHFVYLKKKVPALTYSALAAELAEREIYGVFRETDPIRTYPNGAVGSSVVGFVGADGQGQAGLELKFNTRAGRGRGQADLRERAERQQDPAGAQLADAGPERDQLPAHHGLRGAVGGRAAAGRGGRDDQGRLGLRDRAWTSRPVRCWPWPTPRRFDSVQPQGARTGGPRQPGGQRPVRAGQRAEGADRGGADRLRDRHADDQGGGAEPAARRAAAPSRTTSTTRSCATTCAA